MKYLKKYENFGNITFSIEENEYNDIFNKCCEGVDLQNDTPIMRSLNGDLREDFYLIDPRKYERFSANTTNYYTLMMDNTDAWVDFPYRKHGIISSLNESYFGNEYRVVPLLNYDEVLTKYDIDKFTGSKWGVCPTWDLWSSFHDLLRNSGFERIDTAEDVNTLLNIMYRNKTDKNLDGINFDYFKIGLETITSNMIEVPENYEYMKSDILFLKSFMEKNNMNLYQFAEYIYNPDRNGFRVETYDQIKTHTKNTKDVFCNEVWTDTPVLYISTRLI